MPALDEVVSLTRAARILEVDRSLLVRRALKGEIEGARKVGPAWAATLRQVLESEAKRKRGKRGPAPHPLPERVRVIWEAAQAQQPEEDTSKA